MMSFDPKVVVFLAAVLLVGVVIVLALNLLWRRRAGLNVEKYRTAWLKLENSLDRGNPITYQMAILSADKLLDQALRDSGVSGGTMGERLKSAKTRFTNINDVWFAHKIRNRIAHESDVNLNFVTTKRALFIFKKALKELGAI
jgi:hypothetical protein